MAILTTTIGAFPKPHYVPLPDWFRMGPDTERPTAGYAEAVAAAGPGLEPLLERATAEVVRDQVEAGIDVPTDGEVRRENYIHYHCRHLDGIDFSRLSAHLARGNYRAMLPTVTGPVRARAPFLPRDWRLAQAVTDRPVKMTLPGPMTVADTVVDAHYGDPARLGAELAVALNAEVRALAAAGCRHIQVDEPLFARKPDEALAYGFDNLFRCFDGVPAGVSRIVHMCCGYPDRLDNPDYPKAPRESYLALAEAIDQGPVDAISLEDAHRHNDLRALLPRFRRATVILGCVAVAKSGVEPVVEIGARIAAALGYLPAERLMAAPDCGLGLLGRDLALAKLRNLCAAAQAAG